MSKAKPTRPRGTEYLPLSSLKPDPRNPKAHDLDTIDGSVGRFGYIDAIVRDDRTGYIVSGHGRKSTLERMKERGETPPDGVEVDEEGEWLVPVGVGWSSRTDAEAAAALIALNRTTELGGWVDESLLELLDTLSEQEDGYEGVGFTEKDRAALDALLSGPDEVDPYGEEDFDDFVNGSSSQTLTIKGLTSADINRFREVEGEDDAERLRTALAQVFADE